MLRYLRVFFFVLLFLFLSVTKSFAIDYFNDSFDYKDNSKWTFNCEQFNGVVCLDNSENIIYSNSSITLKSTSADFPVVLSKENIFPKQGNFFVRVKFRYPSVTNRGVGLGIGFTGPFGKLFSQFGIWNDSSSAQNFKFYYNDFDDNNTQGYCSKFTASTNDNLGRQTINNVQLSSDYWHYLEIYKTDSIYTVYIDKKDGDLPLFTTSINNNCIPNIIWFGNFIPDGGGDWTTISLDDVLVSSVFPTSIPTPTLVPTEVPTLVPTPTLMPPPTQTPTPTSTPIPTLTPTFTPTPTLTPTPTPVVRKKKIFILPGLGASWNSEAMVYGKSVSDNSWKMTPFVNNYDGLMELLDKNGLVKDQDYFVWNYDWRKSVADIENKFNEFVNSKSLNEYDDIYLVGHSLGGVVARLWTQDNKDNENIKQVINLGSPNLGSLDTYSVWNGGEVLQYNGISSLAFQILLGLQNRSFVVTDINKIRNFAPVAKDLLPTFDYVSKNNGLVSWNSLGSFNNYLDDKNKNVSDISGKLFLSVGTGFSTPEILKLGNRSIYDEVLNLWPDGELLSFTNKNGDGTVLSKSASFGTDNKFEIVADHGAIVNDSLSIIANKLGLENKIINFIYSDNFKDILVVFVGSPATAELKCGSDIFAENDGFIVAKDRDYSECNLTLSPTGDGLVHLILGNTKENKWNYFEKEVGVGITNAMMVDFDNGWVVEDGKTENFLRDQIRMDLDYLGLINAVTDFDQGFLTKVVTRVFEYRKQNDERIISQRILDYLFDLSNIIAWDKNRNDFGSLSSYVDSGENTMKIKLKHKEIDRNSAVSLIQLNNLKSNVLSMANNTNTSYSMAVVLASGYTAEAIR